MYVFSVSNYVRLSAIASAILLGAGSAVAADALPADQQKPASIDNVVQANQKDINAQSQVAKTPRDDCQDQVDGISAFASQANALSSLKVSYSGNQNAIATAELLNAYTPIGYGNANGTVGNVGLILTVSTDLQRSTQEDFLRQEVLLPDGALLAARFSYRRLPVSVQPRKKGKSNVEWRCLQTVVPDGAKSVKPSITAKAADAMSQADKNELSIILARRQHVDHWYLPSALSYGSAFRGWPYLVLNPLEIKAIRTGLTDTTGGNAVSLGGAIGIGFDAPFSSEMSLLTATPKGLLDVQGRMGWQTINKNAMRTMFGAGNDYRAVSYVGGIRTTLTVIDNVSLNLDYEGSLGANRKFLKDITMLSLKYSLPSQQTTGENVSAAAVKDDPTLATAPSINE